MTNPYYSVSGTPGTGAPGASAPMRGEFALIAAGFALLPTLSGNGSKAVVVNSGGTALTVTTGTLALAGNLETTGAYNTTLAQTASVTLTLPAVSGTLATLAGAETLSNKTLVAPALGTPASGVLTNCTGTASGLTAGTVTTNANLTGPITSVGNVTSVAAQTGTGSTFVMDTSPTITSPAISGGTINNAVIGGTTRAAVSGTTGDFNGAFTLGTSQILRGFSAAQTIVSGVPGAQFGGTNANSNFLFARYQANANPATFFVYKSRGTTIASSAAVQSGDSVFELRFVGDDGSGGTSSSPNVASINVNVDAAVSSGIVPGNIKFSTANAAGANTLAMTIDSSQIITLGTASTTGATTNMPKMPVVAGTPTGAVSDGCYMVDTSANKLWVRSNATWKFTALS